VAAPRGAWRLMETGGGRSAKEKSFPYYGKEKLKRKKEKSSGISPLPQKSEGKMKTSCHEKTSQTKTHRSLEGCVYAI